MAKVYSRFAPAEVRYQHLGAQDGPPCAPHQPRFEVSLLRRDSCMRSSFLPSFANMSLALACRRPTPGYAMLCGRAQRSSRCGRRRLRVRGMSCRRRAQRSSRCGVGVQPRAWPGAGRRRAAGAGEGWGWASASACSKRGRGLGLGAGSGRFGRACVANAVAASGRARGMYGGGVPRHTVGRGQQLRSRRPRLPAG